MSSINVLGGCFGNDAKPVAVVLMPSWKKTVAGAILGPRSLLSFLDASAHCETTASRTRRLKATRAGMLAIRANRSTSQDFKLSEALIRPPPMRDRRTQRAL